MSQHTNGKIGWKSPSNIALVKYWGKYDHQIPANPSISFTLKNAYTETFIEYKKKKGAKSNIDFYFEGIRNVQFAKRIENYMNKLVVLEPDLSAFDFNISSRNSFPHSSGIASSASSMSALALALTDLTHTINNQAHFTPEFYNKASNYARLGSGSACRSVYPKLALWGKVDVLTTSAQEYAVPVMQDIHEVYGTFNDAILIVDSGKKEVSSSVGHGLMHNHPFAKQRFSQANDHLTKLLDVMKTNDVMKFLQLVEKEALSLHSMMMTSDPYFILMKPGTLSVIEKVMKYRHRTDIPVGFTLDAGANVHLLYPEKVKAQIETFINDDLITYCETGTVIYDKVGDGPEKLL